MKYSNGLAFSTIALAILTTGCVKKPETGGQVVYDNSQTQGTYNNSQTQGTYDNTQTQGTYTPGGTTYETADAITYDNTAITPSGSIYGGEATDNTVITTTDAYGQPVASAADTSYGQPAPSSNGAYNDPYASTENFPDPYASGSSSNDSYSSAPASSNTGGNTGGIQLQIAALGDYYAAEEFKNSLSLDPKYSAYVKRGNPNKVIVTGISSVSEANRLKETRFPGAFIVSGGSSYSAPSSYGNNSGYTTNTSYGSSAAINGIGVQIGAFSSHSKAQSAAEAASSKYSPFVKTVTKNGKKLYKAILTGFASESEARSFIANRGSGFVVHGL
jgi:cell division septation protein DedD